MYIHPRKGFMLQLLYIYVSCLSIRPQQCFIIIKNTNCMVISCSFVSRNTPCFINQIERWYSWLLTIGSVSMSLDFWRLCTRKSFVRTTFKRQTYRDLYTRCIKRSVTFHWNIRILFSSTSYEIIKEAIRIIPGVSLFNCLFNGDVYQIYHNNVA